jgi:hypothetical protein
MRTLFGLSKYVVYIAVIGLLLAALAVIVVMLAIFFLGAIAEGIPEVGRILPYGVAISAVLAGLALAVWVFAPQFRAIDEVKRETHVEPRDARSESH